MSFEKAFDTEIWVYVQTCISRVYSYSFAGFAITVIYKSFDTVLHKDCLDYSKVFSIPAEFEVGFSYSA